MLDKRIRKWLFSLIVKPTIKFSTIWKNSKTFVDLISTTAVTFILLMKRICITTLVMFGELLLKVIVNKKIKGIKNNENMAG